MSVFGVFLYRVFLHSDWIRRVILYLFVFSPNKGKYGPEKLQLRTFLRSVLYTLQTPIPVRSHVYVVFCLGERLPFHGKAHLTWLGSHLVSIYISVMKLILNFKTRQWSLLLLHFQGEWWKCWDGWSSWR